MDTSSKKTRARGRLSRDMIEDAAFEVIEREGLSGFSMRKLAAALGCEAMSIYHHYPSQAHLYEALVDRHRDACRGWLPDGPDRDFAAGGRAGTEARDQQQRNRVFHLHGSPRSIQRRSDLAAVAVQVGLGLISEDEDGLYMGPLAVLVSTDTADKARDLHELWFNVLLGVIALHLLAILYYRLRGRGLTWPMITGKAK